MAEENKEENKRNDEPRINELEDIVSDFRERFGIEALMSFFGHEERPKNQD
ncbi:MAG: hypothetical protein M1426_02255 [Patescibacteria group bacterium]|nr:hypothetical protein [Patescibacteria group bacterium]